MVYVISKSEKPLMPTNRHGKVRILLKNKLAKVVQNKRQFLPPPKRWGYPCPKMMKKFIVGREVLAVFFPYPKGYGFPTANYNENN